MILESIFMLDIAALIIIFILIGSIIMKKLYKLKSSKIFLFIIFLTVITIIFDILSELFFNDQYPATIFYKNLSEVFNTLYYVFRNIMIVSFIIYLLSLTDSLDYYFKKPLYIILISLPILISLGFILTNPLHNLIFDIELKDGRYDYSTGKLFIIPYVVTAIYFIIGFINIFRYSYYFTKYQLLALVSIVPITAIALVMQYALTKLDIIKNNILIEMFASVLAMILITTSTETAAELIDSRTGFLPYKQFYKRLSRSIKSKFHLKIYLINLYNYYEIFNKLDFDNSNLFIKELSNNISRLVKEMNGNVYSIDEGLYVVMLDEKYNNDDTALSIETEIVNYNKLGVGVNSKICVISLPDDFKDMQELLKFMRNFKANLVFNDDIVYYNEIKNDKDFNIKNNIDVILDRAFINNNFIVYYQPIFDIKMNKYTTLEALVRLNDSEYGFIEPRLFIKYAESNNKIEKIDLVVIEEAAKFISSSEFKNLGIESININISILDCMNSYFYDNVVNIVNKYNIEPKTICFEIVEGNELINRDLVLKTINKFKEFGVNFILDNYGIGYSNIANFSKMPLETVKIDKSLIEEKANKDVILSNTIELIKSLKRKIVFEGIETSKKNDIVSKYDEYAQGYYYCKPIPKDELIKFLERNR